MTSLEKVEREVDGPSADIIKDMKSLINNPDFRQYIDFFNPLRTADEYTRALKKCPKGSYYKLNGASTLYGCEKPESDGACCAREASTQSIFIQNPGTQRVNGYI